LQIFCGVFPDTVFSLYLFYEPRRTNIYFIAAITVLFALGAFPVFCDKGPFLSGRP
jgi:hypothetical protein